MRLTFAGLSAKIPALGLPLVGAPCRSRRFCDQPTGTSPRRGLTSLARLGRCDDRTRAEGDAMQRASFCDGLSRRDLLRVGVAAPFGLGVTLPGLLAGSAIAADALSAPGG